MNTNDTINLNEQLFWKVIHNKYIFNLIFEKIHEISNDIEQTHHIKSYKFKHMKSVTWMIRFGAGNILKYKLSNKEEIQISKNCIHNMLHFIYDSQFHHGLLRICIENTVEYKTYGYEIETKKLSPKEIKSTKMLIYETMVLLLKNYRQFITDFYNQDPETMKAMFQVLKKSNIQSLEMIGISYGVQNTKSTIKSIKNSLRTILNTNK